MPQIESEESEKGADSDSGFFFIFDYATHTVGQYIKEELTGPEVLIAERSHLSTVGNVYFDQSRRSHFLGSL